MPSRVLTRFFLLILSFGLVWASACRSQEPEQKPAEEKKDEAGQKPPEEKKQDQAKPEDNKPPEFPMGNITATLWLEITSTAARKESDLKEVETILTNNAQDPKPVKLSIVSVEKNLYTCTITVKQIMDLAQIHQQLMALTVRKPDPVLIQYNNTQAHVNYTGALLIGSIEIRIKFEVQKGSQLWIDFGDGQGELEETRKLKEAGEKWLYDERVFLRKGVDFIYVRTKDKDGAQSYSQIDIWTQQIRKITEDQYTNRWKQPLPPQPPQVPPAPPQPPVPPAPPEKK